MADRMTPDGHFSEASQAPPGPVHHRELGFALPQPARLSPLRALLFGLLVVVVVAGAFATAYFPKRTADRTLEAKTTASEHAAIRVSVVVPKASTSDRAILLPGSIRPLRETMIYSRANGYLRKWYVDIGDKAKDGQLLAEIETPELDGQIEQARAQLAQAEATVVQTIATRDFSKSNLERYKSLTPQGVTSQQELEQHTAQAAVDEANVNVAHANVGAQRANIDRLLQLKSFARVTAPFAGTIMSRSFDVGALVTAGAGAPLFELVDTDPVRVFVQVPQDIAPGVRADIPAQVLVREFPGRTFQGRITRSAGALDPGSRTMNTEVRVPNADRALLAGMYAEVSLTLPNSHRVYELPATAVMNDAKGLRVAVVDQDLRVRLVPIVVERDTGTAVLVSSGLAGTERVVKLANAGLSDGSQVEVLP
jgi:membrane fusion protein (multidrug efflux system)